jgi:hypothetical protein
MTSSFGCFLKAIYLVLFLWEEERGDTFFDWEGFLPEPLFAVFLVEATPPALLFFDCPDGRARRRGIVICVGITRLLVEQ